MRTFRINRSVVATGALAVGAIMAFALPAGAAVSVQSSSTPSGALKLGNNATLVANGAAVKTKATVVCPPGAQAYDIAVSVTETVGNGVAGGTGHGSSFTCTGLPQTFTITVTATPGGKAFHKGTGYGSADVYFCGSSGCNDVGNAHKITIK